MNTMFDYSTKSMKLSVCLAFFITILGLLDAQDSVRQIRLVNNGCRARAKNLRHHGSVTWNYDDNTIQGPTNWCKQYRCCCNKRQSPINIDEGKVTPAKHPVKLEFQHLDFSMKGMALSNEVHTILLNSTEMRNFRPKLLLRNKTYIFDSLHFHYGLFPNKGSEHTINNVSYEMETHALVYDSKYKNVDEARKLASCEATIKDQKRIVVIATLYKIAENHEGNPGLMPIVEHIPEVLHQNKCVNIAEDIKLRQLFPADHSYYSYIGSLTTPPCKEIVTWIIFKQILPINQHIQLARFRQATRITNDISSTFLFDDIPFSDASPFVGNNFRPVQKLNERKIYHNAIKGF